MVQKYQALVYTVCHQLVPDVQEAQDLTQETFLAAWRAPFCVGGHRPLPARL